MADTLLVPIHLDALRVEEPLPVVAPPVDFTRLPWNDGTHDVNPDTPYLSEAVVAQPFQDENLRLAPGIHLHWALPDALTHAVDDVFPPVPNRWLVARWGAEGIQAQWVVESDYLHHPGSPGVAESIPYPVAPAGPADPPFRYLGRRLPLEAWSAAPAAGAEYLAGLTAVGYGDPAFAALYPSCRGVFGCHDAYTGPVEGLRYEVLGWYASPEDDPLRRLRASRPSASPAELLQALRELHRWTVPGADTLPDGILCYARVALDPAAPPAAEGRVEIGIGNTGTEALSAYLGAALAPENRLLVERQLEAVQLGAQLERSPADGPAKFREARHEKGFVGVEAGTLWSVVAQAEPGSAAAAPEGQAREELTLPPALAHRLNAANTRQSAYDRAATAVRALRRQLFADWYRHLLCAYPPHGTPDPFPDADEVRDFIERRTLPRLEAAEAAVGTLSLRVDGEGRVAGATADRADTAAGAVAEAVEELCRETAALNGDPAVKAANTRYVVSRRSSPRYWLPTEPVVLVAGEPARPSPRHGADGRLSPDGVLECRTLAGTPPAGVVPGALDAVRARIDEIAAEDTESLAFATTAGEPWNPLLLEWMVELFPTRPRDGADLYGTGYPADYLIRNYRLGGEATDLAHRGVDFVQGANVYRGTSILTPAAGTRLDDALVRELARRVKPALLAAFYASLDLPGEGEGGLLARTKAFAAWLAAQTPPLPPLPADDGVRTATEQVDAWLQDAADPASAWAQGRSAALAAFYEDAAVAEADRNEAWLHENLDAFLGWYLARVGGAASAMGAAAAAAETPEALEADRAGLAALKDDAMLVTLRAALVRLSATPSLTQALSGFNEALLMRRQRFQLPVADPLAFPEGRAFADRVRDAVGGERTSAPQPLDDFNPVRAGALDLLRLRLVDTFGRTRELAWGEVAASEPLTPVDTRHPVLLPPRFAQPLRLNFRWLAADEGEVEMNDHPATSPVCGWLLANHLDGSLMVYDAGGETVGSLTSSPEEPWQPSPGTDRRILVEDIPGPVLRRTVRWLAERQRASLEAGDATPFLDRFLAVVESALEHVEPDYAAQHQSQALLVGRPLALVRATVDLELQGPPAPHQGWSVFREDMTRAGRETHGFERVRVPVRLGEHGQLNDGLVGYWVEEDGEIAGGKFYAPQSELAPGGAGADDPLVPRGGKPIHLEQAAATPPRTVCMLADPRGVVHATCGVAPTKAIDIPADQYQDALRAIEVAFLAAPVLSERGAVRVSLPDEPGYSWSWLARGPDGWTERGTAGVLTRTETAAEFGDEGETVWRGLLAAGWTAPLDADRASVVPADRRGEPELGGELATATPRIEAMLARTHVLPFQADAAFTGAQELREGWLKLRAEPGAAAGVSGPTPTRTP